MNNEVYDQDSLLVGIKTLTGCFIELWGLVEKATPIHSHFKHLFQQPNKTEMFKTVVSPIQFPFFCFHYYRFLIIKMLGLDTSSKLSPQQSDS